MCAQTSDSPKPSGGPPAAAGSAEGQDAHAELQQLADELRQATLHVVWRQWRALGASATARQGTGGGRHLQSLIDPEALALISLVLLPDERRLADLLHDWAARNSDLLSVQRVKNLKVDYPEAIQGRLARHLIWFAEVAQNEGKDLRWRSVAHAWTEKSRGEDDSAGTGSSFSDGPSVRSGAKSGEKSRATRARLIAGASLLLRLRLGVGVGVKADLLAFLLSRAEEWATVREIADATAYTPAAVRRAAEDLATARLIEARDGQPAGYRTAYASWAPLLALEGRPPRWASWHERFVFVAAFLDWAEAARARPLSHYALGAHGRDLLEQHRLAFERDLVTVWSAHSSIQDWAVFLQRAIRSLVAWMDEMA
jgi:hypothetical protein